MARSLRQFLDSREIVDDHVAPLAVYNAKYGLTLDASREAKSLPDFRFLKDENFLPTQVTAGGGTGGQGAAWCRVWNGGLSTARS